jgi:hypothetical protein
MSLDPVTSNPDQPGERTTPHRHPDSVMYTLSNFQRRLVAGGTQRDGAMEAGAAGWLPAQEHHGVNIGDTPTHVTFVELKGSPADTPTTALGPQGN